jgi:prevent-host-death family protein
MPEVSIAEAKTQFSALVDKALAGEPTTVTRRGKAVVAIVPITPKTEPFSREELDALTRSMPYVEGADDATIRALRDDARY